MSKQNLVVGVIFLIVLIPIVLSLIDQIYKVFSETFGVTIAVLFIFAIIIGILDKLRVWK